jgi:hypothetical protein
MPSEEHESMVAAFRAAGAVLTPNEPPSTDHLRAMRSVETTAAAAVEARPDVTVERYGGVEHFC